MPCLFFCKNLLFLFPHTKIFKVSSHFASIYGNESLKSWRKIIYFYPIIPKVFVDIASLHTWKLRRIYRLEIFHLCAQSINFLLLKEWNKITLAGESWIFKKSEEKKVFKTRSHMFLYPKLICLCEKVVHLNIKIITRKGI